MPRRKDVSGGEGGHLKQRESSMEETWLSAVVLYLLFLLLTLAFLGAMGWLLFKEILRRRDRARAERRAVIEAQVARNHAATIEWILRKSTDALRALFYIAKIDGRFAVREKQISLNIARCTQTACLK